MSEKTPSFASQNQSAFYATLRQRINQYFTDHKIDKTGNYHLLFKSIILFGLYIIPYVLIFALDLSVFWTIISYLLMGVGMAGIGFNVMHDANHGSISNKTWVAELMSYSMNMLGGNAAIWKIQHNVLHHTYTNIYGHDEDIHDKPILRLAPEGKWSKIHQFQHYYAIILYGLSTLSWLTVKDLKQTAKYKKNGLLSKIGVKSTHVYFNIIVSKILYFAIFIALPLIIGHHSWYIYIIGFFAMHFVAGLITTTVFQLAHVVEHTDFFQPDDENQIENSWAVHQLMTTCNFARKNHLLSWYVGGLNYQIEHHLFPQISHVHYGNLAPIVKQTAQEFKIPYYEIDTFWNAVGSHWEMLKKLGQREVVSL
jgi:linoleoyl-CoA desaturase